MCLRRCSCWNQKNKQQHIQNTPTHLTHTHTHIVKHSHTCKLTHSHTQTHSMCTEATEKQRRWQISVGEEVVGVNYSGVCERGREKRRDEGGRKIIFLSFPQKDEELQFSVSAGYLIFSSSQSQPVCFCSYINLSIYNPSHHSITPPMDPLIPTECLSIHPSCSSTNSTLSFAVVFPSSHFEASHQKRFPASWRLSAWQKFPSDSLDTSMETRPEVFVFPSSCIRSLNLIMMILHLNRSHLNISSLLLIRSLSLSSLLIFPPLFISRVSLFPLWNILRMVNFCLWQRAAMWAEQSEGRRHVPALLARLPLWSSSSSSPIKLFVNAQKEERRAEKRSDVGRLSVSFIKT